MGGLDILVNNAGITRDNLFLRMKDEEWEPVIPVNLTAAFRLSRAAVKGMMRRRYGRIVKISSVVGSTGNPGQGNYAASKAGLIGMSKALAAEVASRNITVNCVAPGFIESPMTDALNEKQREAILATCRWDGSAQGAEIAAAVVYLVTDEAGLRDRPDASRQRRNGHVLRCLGRMFDVAHEGGAALARHEGCVKHRSVGLGGLTGAANAALHECEAVVRAHQAGDPFQPFSSRNRSADFFEANEDRRHE